ncbi:DEAD/DEAH box helicase [Nocardia aobensis]|uniref:DEAD/DEAH box helicase n=1 Tax=Nocardia aobensis TaxID=257277 RepID=UPI000311EA3C|nr:DEAD/DEAH box helicase [Nocardia aobensis]
MLAGPGFAELGLPVDLVQALRRGRLETAFPIQAAAIPDVLAGRDVLGRAATGSGKTLAFGLPMLVRLRRGASTPRRPRALVLAPTRELAAQIEAALDEAALSLGLRVATAVGGVPIKRQADRLARGVDLLVATPGRLTDLIDQGKVGLDAVRVVAVDEADHMAELGFIDQIRAILDRLPADTQHLLFSATLDAAVDTLVHTYLNDAVNHDVTTTAATRRPSEQAGRRAGEAEPGLAAPGTQAIAVPVEGGAGDTEKHAGRHAAALEPGAFETGTDSGTTGQPAESAHGRAVRAARTESLSEATDSVAAPETADAPAAGAGSARTGSELGGLSPSGTAKVAHYLLQVRASDKRAVVTEIAGREGRTLLFVRTQYGADKLARRLREAGVGAVALHGGLSQAQRTRTLAVFSSGVAPVLVATDVAARGIHVDEVTLVVHVDPAADAKDYLHRSGRTGRAGASGVVVTIGTDTGTETVLHDAAIEFHHIRVRAGDPRLTDITGARPPTGRPISDPAAAPPAAADTRKVDTPGTSRRNTRPSHAPHRPRTRRAH